MAWRLDFAADLFRGAFASNFASDETDLAEKLRVFYDQLGKVHKHVMSATYVLVYEFVWNRFGGNY